MATQRGHINTRKTPKLSSEQWDRLVEKMHQSNRVKQRYVCPSVLCLLYCNPPISLPLSAMIKEQNQGLAHELGGYLFQPRINQTSLDLSATMKSLQHRLPEMIAEKKKFLEHKRKDAADVSLSLSLCIL